MSAPSPAAEKAPLPGAWLNRNVIGTAITSFLADLSYETVRAILPGFMAALMLPAVALGFIEGLADGVASVVKLVVGWWSDRLGRRKSIVTAGYALSGGAMGLCFALAGGMPMILLGRVAAWFGKGLRGPLRDAILAESIAPEDRGKAFGFHRAGDTIGAVVGPLVAAGLLFLLQPNSESLAPFRTVFWLTLIPGFGSALAFGLLVREKRRAANPKIKLWASLQALPTSFRRWLVGIGLFGAGDFSPTLLTLAAVVALTPSWGADAAWLGALLYAFRNVVQAVASYPIGHLSDRIGRRILLVGGYMLGAATMVAFAVAFEYEAATLPVLGVLFVFAGVFLAIEEALEGAMTADLVPDMAVRGTAYGIMGMVNGLGDLVSSVAVGLLWDQVGFPAGFAFSAVLMFLGASVLFRVR
ncbi:MAG: MFS transporter [Gemmataceae bacterium]|nr:MFS transporter [Gemmataceae bacterium]